MNILKNDKKVCDVDLAWMNGYNAAITGVNEESNPYHHHSENHSLWNEGWWVGLYDTNKS